MSEELIDKALELVDDWDTHAAFELIVDVYAVGLSKVAKDAFLEDLERIAWRYASNVSASEAESTYR